MKELNTALFAAIQELGSIPKDAQGQFGPYSSLEKIIEVTQPILAKHGLFVSHHYDLDCLVTEIIHVATGQVKDSRQKLVLDKQTPQGVGSATTYSRRYHILSLLGKASEGDPDAHASQPTARHMSSAPKAVIQKSNVSGIGAGAENYLITWGKYEGQRLSQLDLAELWNYVEFLERKSKQDGKPVGKRVDELKAMLQQLENEFTEAPPIGGPLRDDQIPF